MNVSLGRGAASASLREVDPMRPNTWEFTGFSQHGEDGIIDYLTRRLLRPNRYFIEIGCADGLENNTTWLALTRNYAGLMIDGNLDLLDWCRFLLQPLNWGLQFRHMFVGQESIGQLRSEARHFDPDVFSLDIDGNDYHVAKALLSAGFRPRICVVEYNSAFGPEQRITIPYWSDFRVSPAEGLDLYYGCSIGGWRGIMEKEGYQFVTVDSCGVNAFFIDPAEFPTGFGSGLAGKDFVSNVSHVRAYGSDWHKQFEHVQHLELQEV
jgi:hypothetical protein